MEFRLLFRINGVLALLGVMAFYYSLAYIQSMDMHLYLYDGHTDESLPGSTHFNGSQYRVAGWNAEGGFYNPNLPTKDCVYSVTIMSPNKYTGVAQDIRDLGSMVIGFLVLTLLEQPKKLSEIKKAFFFTSRDHVYYGSTFRTSV
jgi:hypothetical protein